MTLVKIDIKNVASETHSDDKVVFRSPVVREAPGGGITSTAETIVPLVDGVGEKELVPGPVIVTFQCRGIADTRPKRGVVPDTGPVGIEDVIGANFEYTPAVVNHHREQIEDARDEALGQVSGAVDNALGAYFVDSTNLFNLDAVQSGWVLPEGSGTPAENAQHSLSDPIKIIGGGTYVSYRPIRVSFFTNDDFISSQTMTSTAEAQTWTAPANATHVRLSVLTNYLPTAQLNAGSTLLPYEPWYEATVREDRLPNRLWFDLSPADIGAQPAGDYLSGVVTPEKTSFFEGNVSTNLFDQTKITPGVVIPSGAATPVANALYVVSDPIPVTAGQTYSFENLLRLTWLNPSGGHVATTNLSTGGPRQVVAPSGSVAVRISVSTAMVSTCQLNIGDVLLPYEPGGGGGGDLKIPARYLDIPAPEPGDGGGSADVSTYNPYLVDTSGLEEVFTSPMLDPQPGLATVPAATVYSWWDQLATDHPGYVTRRDLGVMSDGVTHMYAYTLKPESVPTTINRGTSILPSPLPAALLMAGTHGYEEVGPWCLWRLAQDLCERWDTSPVLDAMRWNFEMIFIPMVNPVGWDTPTTATKRQNGNGVDLARNFSAGWLPSDPGTTSYSGTAPLSEPETQAIDALMVEVADRCIFGGSFHNFSASETRKWLMLWQAAASPMMLNLGKKLVARMSRKWAAEQSWITEEGYFGYSDLGSPPGSEGQALVAHGIPGSTFETSQWCYLDGTAGAKYDSRVMTLGYEAVVNYIAMGLAAGIAGQ